MKPGNNNSKQPMLVLAAAGIILIAIVGYLIADGMATLPPSARPESQGTGTPTGIWAALLERTPFAYLTPLPDSVQTAIDGTYAKIDQSQPQWWKCLRCADYRVAGGIWKLQFDRGVMRIFYDVTGWRSIASYTVAEDRLQIFNDPYCPDEVGEYRWRLEDGRLVLNVVEDTCAFDLRAKNLEKQAWDACPAPDPAAEIPDQPPLPGCLDSPVDPAPHAASTPRVTVAVHGGDNRFFAAPPDLFVYANTADQPAPEGIDVTFHADTIAYGLHRVLWWNGNWIEATTELPFGAMGVQILGEPLIGWARVLFDGEEVWRGDTSEIWSKSGRHGGYIQISGFAPGKHTLRVESLDFDHRPVTVMGFGFSDDEGVVVDQP